MLGELLVWILNLDREFAFLLALPIAVVLAGYLADRVRKRRSQPAGDAHAEAARIAEHRRVIRV